MLLKYPAAIVGKFRGKVVLRKGDLAEKVVPRKGDPAEKVVIVGKPGGRLCSDKKLSEITREFVISIIGKSGLSEKPDCNIFSIRNYRKENRCDFEDTVNIR